MKKFFKSKRVIIISLSVLCIAILGVCWYAGRDRRNPFLPESPPASGTGNNWSENDSPATAISNADSYIAPRPVKPTEEYPKVVEESEDEVIIDFTDTEKAETTPPELEDKTVKEDADPEHEVNSNPEGVPPATESPATNPPIDNEPAPGSNDGNGAVYDPVFGWVVPGEGQPSIGDSDGDINKMVGNMGN